MRQFALPFVFFLTAGTFLCLPQGFPTVPANQPVARADENSMTAHRELLEKAKKGRIDIYFEGDSITRRWGATDYPELLANWKQNFFGWNAADFGWGADTLQNILWRLNNGELDDINPKIIVLLAGTNNVGNSVPTDVEAKVEDVTRGIRAILDIMRAKAPEATIILMGIFPRNDNIAVMPTIKKINENISKFAVGVRIRFLDVTDKMADSKGRLFEGVMNSDKLHPAIKGYQIWADALKPYFTELLGPPAKEDLAPPPTGDPSAKLRSKIVGAYPFQRRIPHPIPLRW
jgi:lysophospholipase L1-like esterase